MKEFKDDTNTKASHAHGLEQLILLQFLTIQRNLQIQCNLYQNSNGTFQSSRINNMKNLYRIIIKTPNTKAVFNKNSGLEKKKKKKYKAGGIMFHYE